MIFWFGMVVAAWGSSYGLHREPIGLLYLISCHVTGKQYIGQTINPLGKRWRYHKSASKRFKHKLARAMHEHGLDTFSCAPCQSDVPVSYLDDCEAAMIRTHDSCLNGYNGTLGSPLGALSIYR